MNKIGTITTPFFRDNNFADGFKKIKKAGFDCIDFQGLFDVKGEIYKKDKKEFAEFFTSVRKAAEDAGIEVSQVHGPWPVDDTTAESREEYFQYMKQGIEATALMGAKYFVIHPKMPYGAVDTGHEQETYDVNVEFLKRIAPFVREHGVILCVENMPFVSMSMSSVAKISDMLDDVNEDCFAICLDTGHSAILHENTADVLEKYKDRIKVLHVHDNDGRGDSHTWPFFGITDWDAFSRVFVTTDLVLSSEAYPPFKFGKRTESMHDDMWQFLTACMKNIAKG